MYGSRDQEFLEEFLGRGLVCRRAARRSRHGDLQISRRFKIECTEGMVVHEATL